MEKWEWSQNQDYIHRREEGQRRESSGDAMPTIRGQEDKAPHTKCTNGLATETRTKAKFFVLLMTSRLVLTA